MQWLTSRSCFCFILAKHYYKKRHLQPFFSTPRSTYPSISSEIRICAFFHPPINHLLQCLLRLWMEKLSLECEQTHSNSCALITQKRPQRGINTGSFSCSHISTHLTFPRTPTFLPRNLTNVKINVMCPMHLQEVYIYGRIARGTFLSSSFFSVFSRAKWAQAAITRCTHGWEYTGRLK